MLDVKCFLEGIQKGGDLDLTTETLLREMIERKRRWWDTVEVMIIVSLNEVMRKMVDDCGWLGSCLWYALVVFISCVVCDRLSCGVWRSCLFEESEKQQRERVVIMVMIWPLWTSSEKTWTGWISLSDAWVMKDCVCDEHEWLCYVLKFIEQEQEFQFLWISLHLFSGIGS